MKITIESTTKVVDLQGDMGRMSARIWEGHTESGVPVHCYIVRIAAKRDANLDLFEKELQECRAPSVELRTIPLRLIL